MSVGQLVPAALNLGLDGGAVEVIAAADLDGYELAWAAGFFDGEGTIHRHGTGLRLAVVQAEQTTLQRPRRQPAGVRARVGERGACGHQLWRDDAGCRSGRTALRPQRDLARAASFVYGGSSGTDRQRTARQSVPVRIARTAGQQPVKIRFSVVHPRPAKPKTESTEEGQGDG